MTSRMSRIESVEELVQEQIKKAKNSKKHSRDLSEKAAYEKVIADSMEFMLSNDNVLEKLTKLKAQDKGLWEKIKSYITDLVAKIRSVYEGLAPDSPEGQFVAEMKDVVERLQELFTEGLVDASANYQAAEVEGRQRDDTERNKKDSPNTGEPGFNS